MANSTLLNTSTVNLRTLLSNGKSYEVPPYQRDYSWDEEQWEDLWLDLVELETDDRQHYMGALVLQETSTDQFKIIDGQQRLATLSILVIASLHTLAQLTEKLTARGIDADQNQERMELLRSAFLGSKNPVTLRTSPKLTLNRANRRFYEGTLLELRKPASVTALPPAERLLWQALRYFQDRLEERFGAREDGAALANFIYEIVATQLLFIQIVVEDEDGAYTVFETLNARGLELTASDLLKNYLMSVIHPAGRGDLDFAQNQWQSIADKVEPRKLPTFLRHFLNSRYEFVRQERVYKTIRAKVTTAQEAMALLNDLEHAAQLHAALEEPTHSFWDGVLDHGAEAARHLRLYRVTQYRPLVFAVWCRVPELLADVLRMCDVISFRYNLIAQRNTNKLEPAYNEVAIAIEGGQIASAEEIKRALAPIYVSDSEFRDTFKQRAIRAGGARRKLVRYILCALEKQIHNGDLDYETTSATVEHILPERPAPDWQAAFPPDVHERYVNRLGNYLLLEAKLNREIAANAPLAKKREAYARSQYPSARDFDYEEWVPRAIGERQAQMAKVATAIWRLP